MKLYIRLFSFLLLITLISCRKEITVKLHNADIKYVIEGVITNEAGSCKVYISESKPFYEDNQFKGVSGAIVSIKDNGVEIPLTEKGVGTYETTAINGTPGHAYQLSVTIGEHSFSASSTMPQPVLMDSLYMSRRSFGQFDLATVKYTDPPNVRNWYRFVQYVNGVKEPNIFWESDEFTDGELLTRQLDVSTDKNEDPRNIKSGNEVTVEMFCIDEPVFKYWYSLTSDGGTGDGSSAAPANPLSNIQGGALGYFSAQTVNRKTIIAP